MLCSEPLLLPTSQALSLGPVLCGPLRLEQVLETGQENCWGRGRTIRVSYQERTRTGQGCQKGGFLLPSVQAEASLPPCLGAWFYLILTCNAGDAGLIPGLGRSPGGGHGNPLQYSCLENPMDREVWWAMVHGIAKSQT